jgi:hypothetical protein
MLNRRTATAVLIRPLLWPTAVGAVVAFAPSGWWKRPPYLPVPDTELLRWRAATAYGSGDADAEPADIVAYLEWRRRTVGDR